MTCLSQGLAVCLVFVLNLGFYGILCNGSTSDESLSRVRRGGWNMLRLGRGLQMLRLGKRSDSIFKDILKLRDYYDNKHQERQVPLPRYGKKDLEAQDFLESMLFGDQVLNKRETNMPLTDSFVAETIDGYPHIRPAPRGGRYKRSLRHYRYYPNVQEDIRAVALPRFGRLIEKSLNSKDAVDNKEEEGTERAVPAPRIGRTP